MLRSPSNCLGAKHLSNLEIFLAKVGWSVQDLDIVEANEAFAAQAVAVNKARAEPRR